MVTIYRKTNRLTLFIILLVSLIAGIFSTTLFASQKDYTIVEQKDLPNQLGTFRHIHFVVTGIDLYVASLNDNYQAQIYQQSATNLFLAKSIKDLSQEHDFDLAINGGFYTPDFKPTGLFVDQGNTLVRLARDPLLNSCIGIRTGKIFLGKNRYSCSGAMSALQSGLLMINNYNISNIVKRHTKNLAQSDSFFGPHRRTVLAKSADNKLLIIVTSEAPIFTLANLLKNNSAALGVEKIITALNLDGGASTGMFIRFKNDPFYYPEIRSVKTFIFIKGLNS